MPPESLCVSIHAPNEGSDVAIFVVIAVFEVSIHAPNEGSDLRVLVWLHRWAAFQSTLPMKGATSNTREKSPLYVFQSTLPMKGATLFSYPLSQVLSVSIHAPNEGSDCKIWQKNKPARQIWAVHINRKFEIQ